MSQFQILAWLPRVFMINFQIPGMALEVLLPCGNLMGSHLPAPRTTALQKYGAAAATRFNFSEKPEIQSCVKVPSVLKYGEAALCRLGST